MVIIWTLSKKIYRRISDFNYNLEIFFDLLFCFFYGLGVVLYLNWKTQKKIVLISIYYMAWLSIIIELASVNLNCLFILHFVTALTETGSLLKFNVAGQTQFMVAEQNDRLVIETNLAWAKVAQSKQLGRVFLGQRQRLNLYWSWLWWNDSVHHRQLLSRLIASLNHCFLVICFIWMAHIHIEPSNFLGQTLKKIKFWMDKCL